MRLFLISFLFFSVFIKKGYAKVSQEIGFGVGMAMISYAEAETSLEGENVSEPASGSFSSIASSVYWKFFNKDSYDLYVNAAFPLLGGNESFVSAGIGMEYFLTQENHRVVEQAEGFKLSVAPKLRYYIIGELNTIYLAYVTESSKKNDINVEIAGGGGLTYALGGKWDRWGIRASGVVGRGIGVITSTMNFKAFGSVVYFLD